MPCGDDAGASNTSSGSPAAGRVGTSNKPAGTETRSLTLRVWRAADGAAAEVGLGVDENSEDGRSGNAPPIERPRRCIRTDEDKSLAIGFMGVSGIVSDERDTLNERSAMAASTTSRNGRAC